MYYLNSKIISPKNIVAALITAHLSLPCYAGGFQLSEQNASGLGSYHAGGAAIADDASTAYFNPAGLTKIKQTQITTTAASIFTSAHFKGDATRVVSSNPARNESGTATIHGAAIVPAVQIASPISENLYFGFDASVPFGLSTDWANDSIVRYQATKSAIETVNLSPNVGYKISQNLSLGGGIDVQYLRGDFNSVGGINDTNEYDTEGKNHVEGYGYGFHLGILYELSEKTRFGLHYRSKVNHDADGDSYISGPLEALNGGFIEGTARVKVALPATTTFSIFQQVSPNLDLMASVYHTNWHLIKQLKLTGVVLPGDTDGTVISHTNYRDTYTFDIGTRYRPNNKWQLSAGLGFDQSPIRKHERDIRLPDSNRIATAFGMQYKANKNIYFDLSYAHLFTKNRKINKTSISGNQSATLNGKVNADVNILALQMTWNV